MYNEDKLKTEGMELVREKHQEAKHQKARRKNFIDIMLLIGAFLILFSFGYSMDYFDERETTQNKSTVEDVSVDEPVYIICDARYDKNNDFFVTLPDHTQVVLDNNLSDTPDVIREVVICTDDIDNVKEYNVVGLR